MTKVKWKHNKKRGNYTLSNDNIGLSYQPNSRTPELEEIMNILGDYDENPSDIGETALYLKKEDEWGILKGDWRSEYEELFPSKEKCIDFYESKKEKHGYRKWSNLGESEVKDGKK